MMETYAEGTVDQYSMPGRTGGTDRTISGVRLGARVVYGAHTVQKI